MPFYSGVSGLAVVAEVEIHCHENRLEGRASRCWRGFPHPKTCDETSYCRSSVCLGVER